MAGVLVFDIETVPDQDLVFSDPSAVELPEPAPLPKIPFNRVVLIGAARLSVQASSLATSGAASGVSAGPPTGSEEYRLEGLEILSGSESDVLRRFWELARGMRLVSFNGRYFDLPVLESRSLRHGLALPWYFADGSVRSDSSLHLDLLQFLSNGEPRNRARLHDYCKLVGLPGKMGMDGSRVSELVREHRTAELAAYCATDVLQTLGLFLGVQHLRGACQPKSYPAMLREVRNAISRITESRESLEREKLRSFLAESDGFWLRG
jgi:predicted PolB exonuclease-like 3'-5' exonuclease